MPVESAEDRATFFNTDEWGEAALWSRAGGWDPVAVTLVLTRADQREAIGEVDVIGQLSIATVQASELPAGAGRGDRVTIAATGEDFMVIRPLELDSLRTVASAWLQPVGG